MQRTVLIGDVHGCYLEMAELLERVGLRESDRLIFVGDLINKGPNSRAVLERVHRLGAEVVQGNHERGFIKVMEGRLNNKGLERVRRSLGSDASFWCDWMRTLPTFIESDHCLVVHAGLQPGQHPRETAPDILTNIRTWHGDADSLQEEGAPAWFAYHDRPELVVFGHWAQLGLVVRPNAIGLDSGCVYGHRLTALILPQFDIIQVRARRVYCPIKVGKSTK